MKLTNLDHGSTNIRPRYLKAGELQNLKILEFFLSPEENSTFLSFNFCQILSDEDVADRFEVDNEYAFRRKFLSSFSFFEASLSPW